MSLVNFRNYESLDLDLEPGLILMHGDNGQGKSNLLEALYLLAIAKSPRTSSDKELVRLDSVADGSYSSVSATIQLEDGPIRVQLDFKTVLPSPDGPEQPQTEAQGAHAEGMSVQKYVRVNGAPRRAADLVGQVMAVMFSADDLQLVYGSPTVRRRYLDILISQLDRRYLRSLQRYQRVMAQRNHLLRMIREGRSREDELDYWNEELVSEGRYVMSERVHAVSELSKQAGPIHGELTGQSETLELVYRPSVPSGADDSLEAVAEKLRGALDEQRTREIAQGVTLSGPHRDDLQLLIDGVDVGVYASRGQSRTATLAMRLAEAQYLADRRGQRPVLLLDDVLSELDSTRRAHVLDRVSDYEQCFITTTGADSIEKRFLSRMRRLSVRGGRVEAVEAHGITDDPALNKLGNNEKDGTHDAP